jgi:hypothetical protein
MGRMQSIRKVFVNRDNEGEVVCPNCGKAKTVNISNQRMSPKPIRVKCQCGYSFTIILEYRQYQRKTVSIPGRIFSRQSGMHSEDVMVTSLSITGVGFEIKSTQGIKAEDVYEIAFTLDDEIYTIVREEIIVKRIAGSYIGAEFADQEKYHHELDFYLTPQLFAV